MQLSGKVFVVTGAGSGIGRATALQLLGRGARVAAVDLRTESLEDMARLARAGDRVSLHPLDVTDLDAVQSLPDAVIAHHGAVDGLLSIAGIIQPFDPVTKLPLPIAEKVMAVNFWGTYYLDTTFLPLLVKRPEAALVNTSSMGALVPVPGQGVYGASKAAVSLLTECLYAELQDTSVTVTLVIPGAVGTHITENSGVEAPPIPDGKAPKVTSADEAAHQIVEAVREGTFRVLIGSDARMLDRMSRVAPVKAIGFIADRMKALLG
jgi:NAD(P)-dependent dehydrogenase (short-subunit alcohol dehydrogenase family)